jgi:vacuolar-type H+-ATPase subunit E/Vma4
VSFEQWEQKLAAGRAEITNETARAIEKLQQDTDKHSREAHAAAAEALRTELPRWLAPQLEQLTRDLTARLSQEALAQRTEQAQRLEATADSLKTACQQAEETAARLRTQVDEAEAHITAKAETATRALEQTASQREDAANVQRTGLEARAAELQQQVTVALTAAQASWHEQVSKQLEAAQERLREILESAVAETQDRAAGGLNEHVRALFAHLQEETARHATALRESAGAAVMESEQQLAVLFQGLQEHSQKLESIMVRAGEAGELLEHHTAELQSAQQQALAGFQAQLNDVLGERRSELQRESESLFEQMKAHIRTTFEEATRRALEQFDRQIEEMVHPHIARTEEAVQRLAGGRSMLDAALTLHQDRIRTSADEAFAESLAHFRENLGSVEQILQESSQSIAYRSLEELEGRVSDLKHQVVEELFKSAEWYEKKAQTQIQNQAEKAVEQTVSQLRDKAGEISSVFATELDHSSRNFVGHAQTQMEDAVRDSFERARALFAEAADTTAAAFTDEIQRTARRELEGYNQELKHSTEEERTMLARQVTAEQEAFLNRFQAALGGVLQAGVTEAQKKVSEGFAPLLERWRSMTEAHQKEMQRVYDRMGEEAAENYKNRMESVSNQWMLATVASLDHQSREMISGIAATAEEKLREACKQVFAGVGESLRERLTEIAKQFEPPAEPPVRAKSANTGA